MSKVWRGFVIKKSLAVVSGCRSVVLPGPVYPEVLPEQPVILSDLPADGSEGGEAGPAGPNLHRGEDGQGRGGAPGQDSGGQDASARAAGQGAAGQVAALLERARAQAARLEEEARQRGQREGWQAGYRAGRREGWSRAGSEAKALLGEALAFLQDVQQQRASTLREAEEQAVQLALDIAGNILGRELSVPDGLREYAERILRRLQQGEKAVLHCAPEDVALLEPWIPDLQRACGAASLTLAASPAVGRGGVLVETEHGYVDGRLDKTLHRVGEALLARLRAIAEPAEVAEAFEGDAEPVDQGDGNRAGEQVGQGDGKQDSQQREEGDGGRDCHLVDEWDGEHALA